MKFKQRKIVICISQALLLSGSLPFIASADDLDNGHTVTVTAQSRSQEAQAVPIPFQILKADQLDKLAATNLDSMNGYIPGLTVDGNRPTQPSFYLRGVGTQDFGIGTDAPVGIYVDGVYSGKTGGALMNFNDVQRIEVLKGPQGTLFGRNSAGGAISIVSNEPSDELEGEATLRLGNYGTKYAAGLLNIPLNPDWSLRFNVVDNKSDGWLTDSGNGQKYKDNDNWGTRTALLWKGPEKTRVLLTWEHEDLHQMARPAISLVAPSPDGVAPAFPADPSSFVDPRRGIVYNDTNANNVETRRYDGFTLKIEKPFAWGDFTSTTAYRHFKSFNQEDEDGTNNNVTFLNTANIETNTTWQQEFKIAGKNDTADWLGGMSFYKENAYQDSQVNTNTDSYDTITNNMLGFPLFTTLNGAAAQNGLPLNFLGNSWQENMMNNGSYQSQAIYGDVIWHLQPKWNLTTGLRVTHDSKTFSWNYPNRIAPGLDSVIATANQYGFFNGQSQALAAVTQNFFVDGSAPSTAMSIKKSWTDTSPRVVLDYHYTPDIMGYASVTKGYQSGGFNSVSMGAQFQPEDVWNYEVGIKSYFKEAKLMLNASLFHYKFTNLQSLTLIQAPGAPIPAYQVTNSDQNATGIDLDVHWAPMRGLKLYGNLEYIDQKYANYVVQNGPDLSGQPVGTPRLRAAVGADYTWYDVMHGNVDLSIQHAYTGATRCNADSAAQMSCLTTPAFSIGSAQNRTDLHLGWQSEDRRWGVSMYVNNVLNKRYVFDGDPITAVLGTPFASITAPRLFGLQVNVRM